MGKSDITNEDGKTGCISTRQVLWYLVFTGFAVNYMTRINLNIAIVSMIRERPRDNISLTSECLVTNRYHNSTLINSSALEKPNPFSSSKTHLINEETTNNDNKFDWNEKEVGHILGCYFWLHWITPIPGGVLAVKYGTKLVYGLSNFIAVLCCFLMPAAAKWGHNYLLILRTFQGIVAGFTWPSMHNMTAKWIPPNERSKFVTAYLGSSVGAALTYPLCGFIIDRWGWELVFYVSGIVGTMWYTAWWILVYDSPAEHPRISLHEKEYITSSLGQSVAKNRAAVPWRKIITSRDVWMIIAAQWGGVWGLFTMMTNAPTYFKFIHGWNIRATGLLSGMPHIFRMLWAFIFSQLGDYLLRSNKMNRTNVRKLATAVSNIGQGCFMLALAYTGCNAVLAIVLATAATASHGAVSTGPLASMVDISPNYASVILGLTNSVVAVVGFLTPGVVGYLTYQNQTTAQWQKVYWIASTMLFSSGILYCFFSKSELKSWNSPDKTAIENDNDFNDQTNDKNVDVELISVKTQNNDNDNGRKDDTNGFNVTTRTPVNCEKDENKVPLIDNKSQNV